MASGKKSGAGRRAGGVTRGAVRSAKSVAGRAAESDLAVAVSERDHLIQRLSLTFGGQESSDEKVSAQKQKALMETVENAFDQVIKGHADRICVVFNEDMSFEVRDNGLGVPVQATVDENGREMSNLLLAIGRRNSSSNYVDAKDTVGTNGVGFSSVVLLSSRVDALVYRDGLLYRLSFKDGEPGFFDGDEGPGDRFEPLGEDLTALHISPDPRSEEDKRGWETGTLFRVWLDDTLFQSENPYSDADAVERIIRTCYLLPRMRAEVWSRQSLASLDGAGLEHYRGVVGADGWFRGDYQCPGGLPALVEERASSGNRPVAPVASVSGYAQYSARTVFAQRGGGVSREKVERGVAIGLAFQWDEGYDSEIEGFVNTIHTRLGGTHVKAFQAAMLDVWNKKLRSMRKGLSAKDPDVVFADIEEGLRAVVSVSTPAPEFTNQAKEELKGGPAFQRAMRSEMARLLDEWVSARSNSADVSTIAARILAAAKRRLSAQSRRDASRRAAKLSRTALPAKLVESSGAGTSAEDYLFICEGDSAVSGLKRARTADCALLGIRGKIINPLKAREKDVLDNAEVQDIINVVGAGARESFDLSAIRYKGGIVIASDADPDGDNIAVLLLALVRFLFPGLMEAGLLYRVNTPASVIQFPGGEYGARTLEDQQEKTAMLEAAGIPYEVQHLKGLGESSDDVLHRWAFADQRSWTRIVEDDGGAEMLDVVLGPDTARRKEWLASNHGIGG